MLHFFRHNAGVLALVLLALTFAGGLRALDQESKQRNAAVAAEARARSAVDRARTAQVDWDATIARHDSCVARARSLAASRKAWAVTVTLLSTPRPGESPGRIAETVKQVAALNKQLDEALAPIDCAKVSPAPKGPRPVIPR